MTPPQNDAPEDDGTVYPPPGWDPDEDWEASNNDAMNHEGDPADPNDFYEP